MKNKEARYYVRFLIFTCGKLSAIKKSFSFLVTILNCNTEIKSPFQVFSTSVVSCQKLCYQRTLTLASNLVGNLIGES